MKKDIWYVVRKLLEESMDSQGTLSPKHKEIYELLRDAAKRSKKDLVEPESLSAIADRLGRNTN